MKLSKMGGVLEWGAVLILFIALLWVSGLSGGSFSAQRAHELSERSYHYGPSTVVRKVQADKDTLVYLGTYKQWFSADTVKRRRFKWYPGGGVAGVPKNPEKPLAYSWDVSSSGTDGGLAKFFGYVNDPNIVSVELDMVTEDRSSNTATSGTERQSISDDRMFLFVWKTEGRTFLWQSIKGLDREGMARYEQKLQ
ncbi:DUF5044 domain-containing protein [Paenibacillus sp. XY044]|uniref:DUF5044 domain-containing protein n=1 Tax=Paenibacillus sp. XY044 TaxID=2026089 RepID=UPI000B997FA7|nr:DUF5044 domain-containing protein [Paenibacillus sp. XY044]OZB90550.1 hypothetical protein CJP46_32475 [Paenibacillus sp. XY044]